MPRPSPLIWRSKTPADRWRPTTLRALGKSEDFLQEVLAQHPELLGLDTLANGIRPPFATFREVQLETPLGRLVPADVVLLSQSGHLVIVEAKLADNPELTDRQVIAQVLDYATALTGYDADTLATPFGAETDLLALLR